MDLPLLDKELQLFKGYWELKKSSSLGKETLHGYLMSNNHPENTYTYK